MAEKKPSYWEMLRDPRWQRKRLEAMERAGFECETCGEKSKTLNVHHTYYTKGAAPWEYPSESLRCWCQDCHEEFHDAKAFIDKAIAMMGPDGLEAVFGMVFGLARAMGIDELVTWEHKGHLGDEWFPNSTGCRSLFAALRMPEQILEREARNFKGPLSTAQVMQLWENVCFEESIRDWTPQI